MYRQTPIKKRPYSLWCDIDDEKADTDFLHKQEIKIILLHEVKHTDFGLIREYKAYINVGILKHGTAMLSGNNDSSQHHEVALRVGSGSVLPGRFESE
jgi:hypothetical protein